MGAVCCRLWGVAMVSAEGRRPHTRPFSRAMLSSTALKLCGRSWGPAAHSGIKPAGVGLRDRGQASEGRRQAYPHCTRVGGGWGRRLWLRDLAFSVGGGLLVEPPGVRKGLRRV